MGDEIERKNTRHGGSDSSRNKEQDLLYDPNVATSSHAEQSMTLAHSKGTATLSTISLKSSGFPYGSLVTYIIHENNPIFLISDLAEHTQNLRENSNASLLISESGEGNQLALGRITIIGECREVSKDNIDIVRDKFIQQHPSANHYVDYSDFSFFELETTSVRYIGGFGRMSWVEKNELNDAIPDPLAPFALDIIKHMNDDHSDALILYCKTMSKATDTSEAVMTGIDRYGFEISANTNLGQRPIRLAFDNEVSTPDEARKELVMMVKKARKLSE